MTVLGRITRIFRKHLPVSEESVAHKDNGKEERVDVLDNSAEPSKGGTPAMPPPGSSQTLVRRNSVQVIVQSEPGQQDTSLKMNSKDSDRTPPTLTKEKGERTGINRSENSAVSSKSSSLRAALEDGGEGAGPMIRQSTANVSVKEKAVRSVDNKLQESTAAPTGEPKKAKKDLGEDPYGHVLVAEIEKWGIDSRPLMKSPLATRVVPLDIVDSTNVYIKKYPYLPNGTIVVARRQTAGKGQKERVWISNIGGLFASFKLVFMDSAMSSGNVFWIQAAFGLSAFHAIKSLGLKPSLKWPNDVLLNDKKVGGILGESQTGSQGLVVIVGIGINFKNDLEDIFTVAPDLRGRITSIKAELGEMGGKIEIVPFFDTLAKKLDHYWEGAFDVPKIKAEW
ncbi:MAG TPA: biotin--[acetyl-CoA-carboxylase] ligase, partial [Candidatus Hodarchaeales archaeon]|nr:biotin--[acetyl-CoA-carboxylase] ligase [Candidatus Hodarchaeales archaeon]